MPLATATLRCHAGEVQVRCEWEGKVVEAKCRWKVYKRGSRGSGRQECATRGGACVWRVWCGEVCGRGSPARLLVRNGLLPSSFVRCGSNHCPARSGVVRLVEVLFLQNALSVCPGSSSTPCSNGLARSPSVVVNAVHARRAFVCPSMPCFRACPVPAV